MGLLDVDYRSFCPKCGYCDLTYIWENIKICPVCKNSMKKLTYLERKKFNNFTLEQIYGYIQQNIIKNAFDPKYVKMRESYQIEIRKEYQQQKTEQKQEDNAKISVYQNKYLEFLKEAQEQGISSNRAEDIASYAIQHNMYQLPHCPNCGSVDISKISVGTKVIKTATFGVYGAISDGGKTWRCNNCESKF